MAHRLIVGLFIQLGVGLLIGGAGLFAFCGAVFNWDFFMGSYKARAFVSVFGRTGARAFYALLGVILMCGGLLALWNAAHAVFLISR